MTPDYFQQPSPVYAANGKQTVKIGRGGQILSLLIVQTCQPTLTAANNTAGNTLRGDDLAVLNHFRLFGNDGLPLIDIDGPDLFFKNWLCDNGVPARKNATLGDGVTANPSLTSVIEIPFELTRTIKPFDSALDTTRYTDLTAEFTWKDHLAINASATGFTTAPSYEVYTLEVPPHDHPYLRKRIIQLTKTFAGSGTQRFDLDQGPEYRRFLINAQTGGNDTTGLFSRMRLNSGGRIKANLSEVALREMMKRRYGMRAGETPRVNTVEKEDAWYLFENVTLDGMQTQALDTERIATNYLEFDLTAAATIKLTVELLEDLRRPQYGGQVAAAAA